MCNMNYSLCDAHGVEDSSNDILQFVDLEAHSEALQELPASPGRLSLCKYANFCLLLKVECRAGVLTYCIFVYFYVLSLGQQASL